jgi:hypothetical protein
MFGVLVFAKLNSSVHRLIGNSTPDKICGLFNRTHGVSERNSGTINKISKRMGAEAAGETNIKRFVIYLADGSQRGVRKTGFLNPELTF